MKIRLEIEGKNAGSINYKGPESAELAVNYLNSIEADEIQVNIVQDDGTRAFAELEGEFLTASAIKFIQSTVNIQSALKERSTAIEPIFSSAANESDLTLKERLEMFLRFEYPGIWFSSLEVKKRYESVYGKISLSTVSTYLARMHRDNILEKRGNRINREYRFNDETIPAMNIGYASVK